MMKKSVIFTIWVVCIGSVLWFNPDNTLNAQQRIAYELTSDSYDGDKETELVWQEIIKIEDEPWLRLQFDEKTKLGYGSYITITSLSDGAKQHMNANTLRQWKYTSAYFNGDAVRIELFVSPEDREVITSIKEIIISNRENSDIIHQPELMRVCGSSDGRVPSSYGYAGRILPGCTGWIASNGLLVTAGHCIEGAEIIEFNVPQSFPNGQIRHSDPEHQYAISEIIAYQNHPTISGRDWAVFQVYENSETGLHPIIAQNSSLEFAQPTTHSHVRITGYGVAGPPPNFGDSGPQNSLNETQQTHVDEVINLSVSGSRINYKTDTQKGNSGSPIIDESTGIAIGVHNDGNCNDQNILNWGTTFHNNGFWNSINITQNITVTLNQRRASNQQLTGSIVGRWTGSGFNTHTITSSLPQVNLNYGDILVLRGNQNVISNPTERYNRWIRNNNDLVDVANHREFLVQEQATYISQFERVYNATLSNVFPETPSVSPSGNNQVLFKDPWLIDFADPKYGNNMRNRGMFAAFKSVNAGATNNIGINSPYKGVFLNQGGPATGWQAPYYTIRALEESLNFGGSIGVRPVVFLGWTGNNVIFQHPNNKETAVVFTSSNATATAELKASRISDNANAWENTNQRKIVRTNDGWLHMVYESMGHIWYEAKPPGGDWQFIGQGGSGNPLHLDENGGTSPSIDFNTSPAPWDNMVAITWQA